MRYLVFLLCFIYVSFGKAQIRSFPYREDFDTVLVPMLPFAWRTTTNRSTSGDFTTTTSTAYSDSNVVISTNATISQSLISPVLDFSYREADSISFFERRSASHNAGMLLEASTDGGLSFPDRIGDTTKNAGTTSFVRRAFKLPADLNHQESVAFRWHILGNGTGTTGTIRFDNVSISVREQVDVGIIALEVLPPFPSAGDTTTVLAILRNDGIQPTGMLAVHFYSVYNNSSLPQSTEEFAVVSVAASIPSGDTLSAHAHINNITAGEITIITVVTLAGDQNASNDTLRQTFSVDAPRHSLIINELMYAPPTAEPEWVELLNVSTSPLDLKNWRLSNRNSLTKYFISTTSYLLQAGQYCVITKDSTLFRTVHAAAPSPILQVSSLPTFLFNNAGDAVAVFDGRLVLSDSVRYLPSWGGTDGRSLERIMSDKSSNDSTNWGSSVGPGGSTAGLPNSLTPVEFDLASFIRIPRPTEEPSADSVILVVRNVGRRAASGFSASLYLDDNGDSLPQPPELLAREFHELVLEPEDSAAFPFTLRGTGGGKHTLIGQADYDNDMRLSNNVAFGVLDFPFSPFSVIINEIMYEPKSGISEYVELFNRSADDINMSGWELSDRRDASGKANEFTLSKKALHLGPGSYLVVGADSSLVRHYPSMNSPGTQFTGLGKGSLSLNNDGDDIVLRDFTGALIDSVTFSPSWHNPELPDVSGRSLERINPEMGTNDRRNWSTCADTYGGTPGKQNSLYTTGAQSHADLSFSPNPFSPDGDGVEDVTLISYRIRAMSGVIRIRIYDVQGRLIRTLVNGEPGSSHGEVLWDGFDDNRMRVHMGIYIVLLEAVDANGNKPETLKGVVVVAAKL